jgi:hypothetical protein
MKDLKSCNIYPFGLKLCINIITISFHVLVILFIIYNLIKHSIIF